MSFVEIRNVSKTYSGLRIVERFDLTVREGEFVTLLGPSGCGKSTLLNMVAGLTQPTTGSVRVAGREVEAPGPDRGVCFQQAALFPWLSLWDNVTFGPRSRGTLDAARRRRARHLLETFGLGDFLGHRPSQLSGGMQQRASIARILLNDPEVLLMDEPFGALDALTRLQMQTFMMTIRHEHRSTTLFITHDVDEAVYLSDRVVVLSPRPGHIIDEIVIGHPQPRSPDFLLSQAFMDHKARAYAGLGMPLAIAG